MDHFALPVPSEAIDDAAQILMCLLGMARMDQGDHISMHNDNCKDQSQQYKDLDTVLPDLGEL